MQTIETNLIEIFKTTGDVQISPDGKRILYTLKSYDLVRGEIFTSLWLLNIEDGKSDCLMPDAPGISHPRWSPDGSCLVFVRNQTEEKSSLVVMSALIRKPDIVLVIPLGTSIN